MTRRYREIIFLIILLAAICINFLCAAWLTTTFPTAQHHNNHHRLRNFELHSLIQNERYPQGEVIGSTGKIGSYLLNSLNPPLEVNNVQQCHSVAATPRGVSPGSLSPDNTPLYACIPSSSIQTVWDATVPHRREDLVFLCNCIPSRHLNFESSDCTICILHFGVSHRIDAGKVIPILNTSPLSPSTVIYGRHATTLAKVLKRDGITVEIAPSPEHIQMVAAKKLSWSSLFWLLCHDGDESMTVKEVWERKTKQIHELVEEMIPALEVLSNEDTKQSNSSPSRKSLMGTVEEVVNYLYNYSMSMKEGNITPSLELALNEIKERNGVLLSIMMQSNSNDRTKLPQLQLEMIRRVAGDEYFKRCLAKDQNNDSYDERVRFERVECKASNLQFLYRPATKSVSSTTRSSSIIIIGSGILGSSLAHHLSRRSDIRVTVLDKSTNLLPSAVTTEEDDIYPGEATSSSFAWLNANDKSPLSYMQLNQLGMEIWRRHDLLNEHPVWCGSLIKKEKQGVCVNDSHYVTIGPINGNDAIKLEPSLKLKENSADKSSEFYFYPEEGFVDPPKVVKDLRVSAHDNGVNFIGGAEVVGLIRNQNGNVTGVKYTTKDDNIDTEQITADLVIVTCGATSNSPALGIGSTRLPLDEQPGALTYISDDSYIKNPMKRIFVDTINETHMLRRSDGTLVIGGGKLVVGGQSDQLNEDSRSSTEETDSIIGERMIASVMKALYVNDVESFTESCEKKDDCNRNFRVTKASRPIATDGLPVVGFVERGLYVAMTHSGVTLAPLIGELASHEIEERLKSQTHDGSCYSYGFQILDAYRPDRFTGVGENSRRR